MIESMHRPKVLKVGTVVLLENTMQKQCKGGKLEPLWLGPYTIHRDLGKGLYELSNQAGTVLKKKGNIARLKEYVKRAQDDTEKAPPPSDTQPEKSPPPSDTQPEKSPPPSDTQPEKSRLPSHPQPRSQCQRENDFWVKELDLTREDKTVLERDGAMLTDKHTYAAHKLLRIQFPHLQGCHSTLLL